MPHVIPIFRLLNSLYSTGLEAKRFEKNNTSIIKDLKNCVAYWQQCLLATHLEILKVCNLCDSNNQ